MTDFDAIAAGMTQAVPFAGHLGTLDAEGKVVFPCEIELFDASGQRVANATVQWHVRLNQPAVE